MVNSVQAVGTGSDLHRVDVTSFRSPAQDIELSSRQIDSRSVHANKRARKRFTREFLVSLGLPWLSHCSFCVKSLGDNCHYLYHPLYIRKTRNFFTAFIYLFREILTINIDLSSKVNETVLHNVGSAFYVRQKPNAKIIYYLIILGAWGSVVVKALHYQSDGLGIDSRWCHWGFFPQLPTEPCALGSTQPLKMSTRDFSWGKGGRCVRLTTSHPRSAERQKNPGS